MSRSKPPIKSLSPEEFADIIRTISELPEYFDSDNIVSNETDYHVVRKFRELGLCAGAYIGVGPDQNFTYIAALRPTLAFILDIRRDNLLEHLLFKALFQMATTRQEYLSLLFSKPAPAGTGGNGHASIDALVTYFDRTEGDEAAYWRNLTRIDQILGTYQLDLSPEDLRTVEHIYRVFFTHHLNVRFEFKQEPEPGGLSSPTYRAVLLGTDRAGRRINFLHSDEAFAFLKGMHAKNLIIPVTGNFAGETALAGIAAYLHNRGELVSALYLSNVEFYLVPHGELDGFVRNVKQLPLRERSVLVRTFVNMGSAEHPASTGGHLMTPTVQWISSFIRLHEEGRYRTYWDVGTADYLR